MKPKYVYLVVTTRGEKNLIVGCFYSKDAAYKYTGGDPSVVIQKLPVE